MGIPQHDVAVQLPACVVVQVAVPQRPVANIGILLLDPSRNHLYMRFVDRWEEFTSDEDELEILSYMSEDFQSRASEQGGEHFLRSIEDSLSNFLLLSPRKELPGVDDFEHTLNQLFADFVLCKRQSA